MQQFTNKRKHVDSESLAEVEDEDEDEKWETETEETKNVATAPLRKRSSIWIIWKAVNPQLKLQALPIM
ncbi:unnamed protein product [Mucor hiemalis]